MGNFCKRSQKQIIVEYSKYNISQNSYKKIALFSESNTCRIGIFNHMMGRKFDSSHYTDTGYWHDEKIYYVSGKKITYRIWSFGSDPEFYRKHFINAQTVLIIFDLNNLLSIKNVPDIISNIFDLNQNIVLVANKVGNPNYEKYENLLKNLSQTYHYFEVSAKTGEGIRDLMDYLHDSVEEISTN